MHGAGLFNCESWYHTIRYSKCQITTERWFQSWRFQHNKVQGNWFCCFLLIQYPTTWHSEQRHNPTLIELGSSCPTSFAFSWNTLTWLWKVVVFKCCNMNWYFCSLYSTFPTLYEHVKIPKFSLSKNCILLFSYFPSLE